MNRSALCIKMLHILYGRSQPISSYELAEMLETNRRNVQELKKELEIAGYFIDSTSGKYGGYLLKEESIFPSLTLDNDEKEAINEALTYLKAQKNFIYYPKFEFAMNKLKAKVNHSSQSKETIYLNESRKTLSKSESEMLDIITMGKEKHKTLSFMYHSSYHNTISKRNVLPYEIIVTDEGFYLLADDKTKDKTSGFKYFKIIDERMSNVKILNKTFTRDADFKASDYIGSTTLMKEMYEVELEIYGLNARLVNEREIENLISKSYLDGILNIKFMMEGNLRLKKFILSLGSECKVIAPENIKEEIKIELLKANELYKEKNSF